MTLFGDQVARDELILNCVPVVISAAERFSQHELASYDDLFQEGMMGVMEAIEKYDYTSNVKFSSFAYTRIIHKLVLWTKKQCKLTSATVRNDPKSGLIVDSTIETFHSTFQTFPTDKQIAKLISATVEDVIYIRKHYENPVPVDYRVPPSSIRDPIGYSIDASKVVESAMCSEYNRTHLWKALNSLADCERDIVVRRYLYEEKKATLDELAKDYEVNCSTILRRERHALSMILSYFKANGIHPEL